MDSRHEQSSLFDLYAALATKEEVENSNAMGSNSAFLRLIDLNKTACDSENVAGFRLLDEQVKEDGASHYASQPINGSDPTSTSSQKQDEDGRENNGIDLNKRPKRRPRKKYWPKVVSEGKPTRILKARTTKPATPKCVSVEKKVSGKRKYVRRGSRKNLATPSNVMVIDREDEVGDKMVCEGKRERAPELKMLTPAAPSRGSGEKMPRKSEYLGQTSSLKTCKQTLSFDSENHFQNDGFIARNTSQCQLQNSCRSASTFDSENHAKEETTITVDASPSQAQNGLGGKKSGALVSHCSNYRGLANTQVEKPVQEYNHKATNHNDHQCVQKRKFKVNQCCRESRKIRPVFPEICKKKRMRQRRRTDMSSITWSPISTGTYKRQDITCSKYNVNSGCKTLKRTNQKVAPKFTQELHNVVCNSKMSCYSPPANNDTEEPTTSMGLLQSMTTINDGSCTKVEIFYRPEGKTTKKRSNMFLLRRNIDDLIALLPIKKDDSIPLLPKKKARGSISVTKKKRSKEYTRRSNVADFPASPVCNCNHLPSERQEQVLDISRGPESCNDSFVNSAFHDQEIEGSLAKDALFGHNHETTVAEKWPQDNSESQYSRSEGSLSRDALSGKNYERSATWNNSGPSIVGDAKSTHMESFNNDSDFHNRTYGNPQENTHFQPSSKSRVDVGTQDESLNFRGDKLMCLSDEQNALLEQDRTACDDEPGHHTLVPVEEQYQIAYGSNGGHGTSQTNGAYVRERKITELCPNTVQYAVNLEFQITRNEKIPSEHEDFLLKTKSRGLQELDLDALLRKFTCMHISDVQNQLLVHYQNAHGPNSRDDTLVPYQKQNQNAHDPTNMHCTLVPYQGPITYGPNCRDGTLVPFQKQDQNAHDPTNKHRTLVPYKGPFEPIKKRRELAKVNLDPETMKVWNQLMDKKFGEDETKADEEKDKRWAEERNLFTGRVNAFVASMNDIQGNRRFKKWKGSVVDSVCGVFLTQNVSDHLSSSAYMSLASKFPARNCRATEENLQIKDSQESVASNTESVGATDDSVGNELLGGETEPDEWENGATLAFGAQGAGLEETQGSRVVKDAVAPHKSEALSKEQTTEGSQFLSACSSVPDLGPTNTHFSIETSGGFAEPQPSEKTTLLQKLCYSHESSILTFKESSENEYANRRGIEFENKNLYSDRANDLECNQDAYAFEPAIFSNLVMDHLDILNFKKVNVEDINNEWMLIEDSCLEVIVEQKKPPTTQEAATDYSYASNRFCLPPGYRSQAEHGIEKWSHNCNSHRVERTNFQAKKRLADEPENSVDEMAQSQKGKMHPGVSNTMNRKRSKGKNTNSFEQQLSSSTPFDKTKIAPPRTVVKKVEKEEEIDWDKLRRIYSSVEPRSSDHMDSVDWEAVRYAQNIEIARAIQNRGQHNIIARRIKDFLNRVVDLHKSIDLEWLRNVPPDLAKEYLLKINGLGLKSVECVRLLTLQNIAFPVDTNVARITVRLGWVPLQPLPGGLQIHLLEQYPLMDTVQKYLWPRLCTLDQRTLYELHYHLITFGKVFCTKKNPNCNACPMKGDCRHFASAIASARLGLPAPVDKSLISTEIPNMTAENPNLVTNPTALFLPEPNPFSGFGNQTKKFEPIIEEPALPEPEYAPLMEVPASPEAELEHSKLQERDIEDFFKDDSNPDEIIRINLSLDEFTTHLQNLDKNQIMLHNNDMSKALVPLEAASIPMPKLKSVSRLRTEHQVYVLPDTHPLLTELDKRECDDPCPYLLAIWKPGETANSFEPPTKTCNSQSRELCNKQTCSYCNSVKEQNSNTIRGTILIPSRTAMKGRFPLNGTYFQVNEVFADDETSQNPINVPRQWIWHLERRTAYFGSSTAAIFRGLSVDAIRTCFKEGFICVRGFETRTGTPRPLAKRLHVSASKLGKGRSNDE